MNKTGSQLLHEAWEEFKNETIMPLYRALLKAKADELLQIEENKKNYDTNLQAFLLKLRKNIR